MIEAWGKTADGQNVDRIKITNGELTARIITYGASLQDLRIKGHNAPLVLGLNSISDYEAHGLYFGAVVGRYANRVGHGRFSIDGTSFDLPINDGGVHHLHGGPKGFFACNWEIVDHGDSFVELKLHSADGDMGYPGNLDVYCRYEMNAENGLQITFRSISDASTIANFASHAYFNLDDGGASNVNLHRLQIDAETYLASDETNLPTGEQREVSGNAMDFRVLRPIGDYSTYDHNFCLSPERKDLRKIGRLVADASGIEMDIYTTEPGLQLYGGRYIAPMTGLDGIEYANGSGICLETQIWPDAPNHIGFPKAVLSAGEELVQRTEYRFRAA